MLKSLRLLGTMFVVLLCGMAFAQSGYVYTQELDSVYASRSIYVCSDNSVVVLGNSDDIEEFHYMSIAITKLDPLGNLLWRRYIYPGVYPFISITGVDIDAEDKVTFITTYFGGSYIQLGTIDSIGVINFLSNPIEIPIVGITFNKALRTPNNEIVAVGKASQWYDVSSACYFRFSAIGDTLATAFWTVDQGSQYLVAEAFDLAMKDNGNILVTCSLYTGLGTILEINQNGSIVNRTNLPGNDHFYVVSICREDNNPSYIVAYRMGEFPNMNVHINRFEGGLFEPLFLITNNVISDVDSMILGADCLYICGYLSTNGVLVKLNYNGDIYWVWNYQGYNSCPYLWDGFGFPSTALLGLDSDSCVCWAWGNSGQQVVIKLLPNGQVPAEDEIQTPPVNFLSAYPNPMKDHINIKIGQNNEPVFCENSIDIFNIKGQLVRSLMLTRGVAEWDGKDNLGNQCSNGIYLLRLANSKTHITKICKTF
ncbi:MAG: T9SS type A sorting domain-containing protein [Candidatus Cloacimonadaceae bacterium]|nr:T9SS type A sorting domain-containing protein [Candidatus Cloacimonadaceae bacterium]